MEKAITRRKWTTGLIIAGAAALVITFWSLIMSMLSLLAVAGVLTLLSLPLCKVLEKRLPGGAAAAIALLTLLGAVLGMLWGLIPPLLRQSALLMSRLPALLDSLRELLARWSAALEARGIPLGDMQAELFSRISAAAGQLAATLVSGIRRLTGSVSQWLLAPLLSFYFLRDRKRLCLLLSLVLPVKYRARGIRAAREMRRESALYLRGQMILSLFVAAMTALALLLTRTPGALLLGLFMGVMELIPYIGPFIAGVPAVLLALQSGWTAALWTLLAICLVQQVEANLLSPRLLSGATRLHPLAAAGYFAGVAAVAMVSMNPVLLGLSLLVMLGVTIKERVSNPHLVTERPTAPQGMGQEQNLLANAIVSFSCAMQVQAFRKVNGYAFASTMCIGDLRSGVEAFCIWRKSHEPHAKDRMVRYFGIIFLFALGAGLGSKSAAQLGGRAIWISCCFLLVSFALMFIREDLEENPVIEKDLAEIRQETREIDHALRQELQEQQQELKESAAPRHR